MRFRPTKMRRKGLTRAGLGSGWRSFWLLAFGEGFEPGDLIAEDWGWMVPIKNEGFPLWIGCGNYDEHPEGFLCFIEPHTPVIRRFLKKIDTRARVETLQSALDRILSGHSGVRDKRWWTHEEFNQPQRA
jgi:hypothetical protein